MTTCDYLHAPGEWCRHCGFAGEVLGLPVYARAVIPRGLVVLLERPGHFFVIEVYPMNAGDGGADRRVEPIAAVRDQLAKGVAEGPSMGAANDARVVTGTTEGVLLRRLSDQTATLAERVRSCDREARRILAATSNGRHGAKGQQPEFQAEVRVLLGALDMAQNAVSELDARSR